MSASAQERWSCQRFEDAADRKTYFVSVRHVAAPGEEGCVDLALTDSASAWTAQGVTSDAIRGQGREKLRHLLAALSELEPAEVEYRAEVAPEPDGTLGLRLTWQKPPATTRVSIVVALSAVAPPAPIIASMLDLLVANLAALRDTSRDLLQQSAAFQQLAARNQGLVDRYVKTKAEQDKADNVRVAALLNSKKAKLRELKQALDEAQEEIKRLKEGGGGAAAMEDDGAAGTSAEAGGRRPGKRAQVLSEMDEEDEHHSDDDSRPSAYR